jgi:hypothetical protein
MVPNQVPTKLLVHIRGSKPAVRGPQVALGTFMCSVIRFWDNEMREEKKCLLPSNTEKHTHIV